MRKQAGPERSAGWAVNEPRDLQERIALAMQAANMGWWEMDLPGGEERWSQQTEALLGLAPGTFDGRRETVLSRVHPDDAQGIGQAAMEATQPGDFRHEFRIVLPDQSLRWLSRSGKAFTDETGRCTRLLGVVQDITAQKQVEEDLHQSELRFRHIAANLPGAILRYVLHPDGSDAVSYMSPGCLDLWELQAEAIVADTQRLWDMVHVEDRAALLESLSESARTLQPWRWQWRITSPSGGMKWLEGCGRPQRFGNGDVAWDTLITDVSERRQMEAALQESEARWQFALEGTGDGVWDWNAETDTVDFSRQWKAMLGYAEDEIGSALKEWEERVHPEDLGRCHSDLQRHFLKETPVYRNEHRLRCKDGSYKWVLDRGKVMAWNAEGQPLRVIGTHTDIDKRKQAEAMLQAERQGLQLALDAAQMGTWSCNPSSGALAWSDRAATILGLDPESLPAHQESLLPLIHPDDRDRLVTAIRSTMATDDPFHIEVRIRHPDQTTRWLAAWGRLSRDGSLSEPKLTGVLCDVTSRRLSEEALRESEAWARLAIQVARLGVWRVHLDTATVEMDARLRKIWGEPEDSRMVPLARVMERVHPEDRGRIASAVESAMAHQSEGTYEAEYRLLWKDGSERWVMATGLAQFEGEGESRRAVGFFGTLLDITDRKQLENALRENLDHLQQLNDNVPAIVYRYVLHPDGQDTITYLSDNVKDIYELPLETCLNNMPAIWERIHPDDIHQMRESILESAQTLQPWRQQYRFTTPSGQQKWLEAKSSPKLQPNGDVVWDGVIIDISDQKASEIALRESMHRHAQILDSVQDMVFCKDVNSVVQYANQATCLYYGMTGEQLRGLQDVAFNDDRNTEQYLQDDREVFLTGKPIEIAEEPNRCPDGSIRYFHTIKSPIFDTEGKVVELVGVSRDITERKRVEEELHMSIKALSGHFDTSLLAIIEWDQNRKIKRWSRQAEQIFGWSESEVQLMDIPSWRFVHEEDATWVADQLDTLRKGLVNSCRFENRNYRKDGSVITCEWHSSAIFDDNGNLQSVLSFAQDISERRHIQEQLREQKELLQNIFDHLPVMVGLFSKDDELLIVNRALEKVTGWSLADCMTVDILRECYPDPKSHRQALKHMMKADSTWKDFRVTVRNGCIVDTSWASIRFSDGRRIGIGQDISDRKLAERQLQSLVQATAAVTGQNFFPALVEHISQALNVNYAIVTEFVEGRLHTLAYWANGTLQPDFDYYPAKTPCALTLSEKVFYCANSVCQRFPDDVDLARMQAESYLGVALLGSHGEAIGHLCVLHQEPLQNPEQAEMLLNVFSSRAAVELERERANRALGELNRQLETLVEQRTAELSQRTVQLEASNKELESFSYSVSHDLRAPLRHINGFVNALQLRLGHHQALDDPKVAHYLRVIESSSQKMGQLIDGLLTLSRMGRRTMEVRPVDLRELVDQAIRLVQEQSHPAQTVKFVIGPLPMLQGDAVLLQQVFSNLISNAVKFSSHLPSPIVEIGSLSGDTVYVRDNGIGFQMKYADKLFGPFQRLHSQADFEGTGIGLTIVQRIIHRHGGRIWAESEPDSGATFYFTLKEIADDAIRSANAAMGSLT